MLTLSFVVEAVSFDDLLLDLRGHGEHELQHLAHVVAGTFPGLLHPRRVFRHREGLDDLAQYHWEKPNSSSYSGVYLQWLGYDGRFSFQWVPRGGTVLWTLSALSAPHDTCGRDTIRHTQSHRNYGWNGNIFNFHLNVDTLLTDCASSVGRALHGM